MNPNLLENVLADKEQGNKTVENQENSPEESQAQKNQGNLNGDQELLDSLEIEIKISEQPVFKGGEYAYGCIDGPNENEFLVGKNYFGLFAVKDGEIKKTNFQKGKSILNLF